VCSAHFKPDDYKWSPVRKMLLASAVPSIFTMCVGWDKFHSANLSTERKAPAQRQPLLPRQENLSENIDKLIDISPISHHEQESLKLQEQLTEKERELATLQVKVKEQEHKLKEKDECIQALDNQLALQRWGLNRFSNDDSDIKFYTGFFSYKLLILFFDIIKPTASNMRSAYYQPVSETLSLKGRPRQMLLIDELFMTLMRLRRGFPERDLALRFNISESTISRKLITWLNLLYILLGSLPIWLTKEEIVKTMPRCFRSMFPSTRVIIDCTEIETEYASSLVLNSQLFSSYKSRPTFKALVGISPHGAVTFISHLFTGSMSDIAITKLSGILDLMQPGDMIMADKGFKIEKLLEGKKVALNLPPFLSNMQQFTPEEVSQTEEIASAPIHVERAIRRIKEFKVFDKVPLSMIGSVNQMWAVCCILTNFQLPLIKNIN